ncbi:phospholipase a2 [Trichoderma arundinaceum]|uniref:Putative phospholipase n=1 Tax=Trichoderma arundinaceum TaxID=490622 RepID=A0A395NTI8_TRIAR|nr:phospholipase a2 [Trichoderma arundinaceum]
MIGASGPSTASRLSAYLSRLSPVPAFPEYTGPFKVGTVDVEIPVADLPFPSPRPENASEIPTVLFRVFYPAVAESNERLISWLPTPQRHYVSAYTKFMGVGHTLAELLSFLPRHLHYTSIPAHKNATLASAETENKRWPTMIFSHGLGGSRNSYSYVAGSLASHGIVVICPEHRDGSAVTSFVRVPGQNGRLGRKVIPYNRISHTINPEVYEAREAQLRIRLWEMGLIHEAVLAMDAGREFANLNVTTPSLSQFVGRLHVNDPGSIIFAGHSFGAATVYQLLKSTYYATVPEVAAMESPIFTPAEDSNIRKQVTEQSLTMLLDMWALPSLDPKLAALYNLPLPLYADVPSAPGGTALLAVESEAFFKWNEHIHATARLLSPDPAAKVVTPAIFERPSGNKLPEPNFFYVVSSAHLSQSDFGILFPLLTRKIFNAVEPERALRLNLRAQLQFLRINNIPVARTWIGDLVDGAHMDKLELAKKDATTNAAVDGLNDDSAIFDRSGNDIVDHWKWIDIMGLGEAEEKENSKSTTEQVEQSEEQMKGQLEPSEQPAQSDSTKGVTLPQGHGWQEI